MLHGAWEEALNEATRAAALAAQAGDGPAIAGAQYVLGEIHRLRGEHDDALHAYKGAHRDGRDPLPGMALLRLATGGPAAARAMLQRACDESDDALARARLLPALVEILVATGAAPEARVACNELAATAASFGSTVLAAVAAGAGATVDLLDGDAARALAGLREAERMWRQLDAPYELARVQVARSEACGVLGDDDGAALDRTAARETSRSSAPLSTSNASRRLRRPLAALPHC